MAEVRQHILITGASAGIGKALARILAPDARISALARRTDRLSSLSSEHEHITGYQADVASFDSAKQAVSRAVAESGPVDMLILNAGIYQPVSAEEFDAEIYRKHMDINYMGVINLLELVIKDMIAAKQGHIVIMASVAGYRGLPRSAAYGPTKSALQNLSESLYFDLKPAGVKIQLVNPGFVETEATSVNDFKMPGLISAHKAAEEIKKGISSDRFEIAFPRGFVWYMKMLSLLPYSVYLRLVAKLTGVDKP